MHLVRRFDSSDDKALAGIDLVRLMRYVCSVLPVKLLCEPLYHSPSAQAFWSDCTNEHRSQATLSGVVWAQANVAQTVS